MKAKYKYVLQVDDDILLSKNYLKYADRVKKIKNKKAAVGPIFFDDKKNCIITIKMKTF